MTKPHTVTPHCLAMVVCDQIWRDPGTGKHTLLGTFNMIRGPRFPIVHPVLAVYLSLTDGRGRLPVKLELVDVDDEREPVFVSESEVEFPNPHAVLELAFHTTGVCFPEPGDYRLKLFANQEFLLERRIDVASVRTDAE